MEHREYWIKRFEQLEAAQNDKGVEYYHHLTEQYNKAISSIEKDISKWYMRYATENGITLTEAKRLLNSRELAEFRMNVKEYIEKGESLDQEWAKQLEAASVRVHVSRLEALKIQMQQQAEMLYGYEKDGLDDLARRIYTDGYYHTAYEIQKGIGVGWDLMRLDANRINKVISKPWAADGRNFSDRLWTNKAQLVSELENTLTQSIIRGHSPKKAISQIAGRMKVSRGKAGRLVMTESAFFASASQKDAFNDLDVEKFEIVATLDGRTSETCRYLDGKVIPMKDYKPGVTAPPFHVWCRTTTAPYFDDEFTVNEQRAARDEDGKYYTVPGNMKYPDWEKAFVDGGSKKGLELYNESKAVKSSKTAQEQSKADTGTRSLNDIEKLNVDATDGLLDIYEARRRHFNLNMVPADELRGSKMNSVTADYTGVSVDTAKMFNDTISKLSKDYYSGLTRIEVADKKTMFGVSDFAVVSHNNAVGQKVLRLNPLKTKNLEELVNRIEMLSENGYAVRVAEGKAAEYVATHEFAHSLIDMTSPLKNFVGIDVKHMKAIRKEIDDVFDAYKKDVLALEKAVEEAAKNPVLADFGADAAEQMKAFQKMADTQKALKAVKLSEYSLKNADEFLAEAFTHSKIGIGKNKHAEKLMTILDKHFKKLNDSLEDVRIKQKDIVEKVLDIEKTAGMAIEEAAKGANPYFRKGTSYADNCQRCVQAYELRRRGYDVIAKASQGRDDKIGWGFECFADTDKNPYTFNQTKAQLMDVFKAAEDGERYSVYIIWKGRSRSSHVFIAEKVNGKMKCIDPQSGNLLVSEYFKRGREGRYGYFRLDDKQLTTDESIIAATVEVKQK